MAKPIGPKCNLRCEYCFYLEKETLYQDTRRWQMDDATLERFVEQYIASQNSREITFAWQGGEPTLMGVKFFRKVVALQQKYGEGRNIHNAFQTNGTLLTDEWCELFKEHNFLIGISVDGPAGNSRPLPSAQAWPRQPSLGDAWSEITQEAQG